MLRFKHKTLIFLAGSIWLVIGIALMSLGLRFLVETGKELHYPAPLHQYFHVWIGNAEHAAMILITLGLLIGFFKGRFVLNKSVNRFVSRIRSYPEPTPITWMYNFPYYVLLASMFMISFGIKYFGVPYDIRGIIDLAVGAALINGSTLYYRAIYTKAS